MSLKEQGLKQYNAKNGTNYKMTSTAGTGGADTASPENAKRTSLKEQGLKQYNAKNGTGYKMTSTSKPSTSKPSTSKPSTSVFTQKKTSASDKDSKKRQQLVDVYAGEYMSMGLGDKGLATQMAENRVAEEEKKQQEKDRKKYEKELKEIKTKDYKDNFLGQFKANYTLGDLSEESNLAVSEYLSNPTEENKLKAERAAALKEAFLKNTSAQEALDDENAKATWVTKDLATYLPQFKNQQIAGLKGAAPGAAGGAALGFVAGNATGVGAFLPEELVTVPGGAVKGGKAGYAAGVAKYSYDTMRGAAYQQMIEAGVPEDVALEAANDEGLINAMIEGGSTLLGLTFLGFDKLGRAIIGTAGKGVAKGAKGAKGVAKSAGKGATSAATKKALSILAGYGLNVAQEALEEGSQEVVSIANENRLKNGGDTGVLDLAGKAARQAFNLNDDEKARVGEAAAGGAKIAAMMGAAGAATSNTLTYAVNKAQDAKVGSSVKASDMTSTVLNAALESTDEKTKAKATQIMQDLSSGKDVSDAKLGSLFKAVSKENAVKAEAQAKATAEVQDSPVVKAASTSDNTISKVFAQKQVENPTAKVATPTTENLMAQGVSTEKAVNIGDAITTAVEGGAVSNKQVDTILGSSTAKAEFEAQTGVKLSSEKSKARKQIKEYAAQVAQQKTVKAEAAQAEVQTMAEQNAQQAKAQAQAQARTQAEVQMMAEQNAQQAKAQAQAQMQEAKAQQQASTTQQESIMQYPEFARQMRETDPNATDMQIAVAYQNYRDSKTAETEASPEIDAQHLRDFVEKVSAEYPDMTPQQLADAYRDYKADSTKQQETEEQTEAGSQETEEQTEARSQETKQQETEEQTEARSQVTEEQTETKTAERNADVEYVAKKATEAFKKYGLKVETYYDSKNKKQKGFVDGDTIHLNAATLKGRNAAAYTLAHELMHPAIATDKTLAKDFLDVVKKSGIITEADIQSEIDKARPLYEAQAKKMGKTDLSFITDDYLREEVVCNLASDVFGDIGLLERVANQDAGFFAKMMTGVKRIIGTAKDAALKKDYQEIFDRMDKALKANKDNLVTEAEDGSPRFHIETYELGGKELLHNWLNSQKDLDAQTKKDIIEGMDKAYELATSLKGKYAAYDAWNEATVIEKDGKPVMSVIVNNGEYKLNIDFSTICKKRKHLDQVLNALVRTDGTALARASQEDIAEMNRIIKEHGFEIACGLCFVDAKRYRIAGWASSFTDMWNELADSVRETPVETLKLLNKETGAEGVGQDLKALRANTKTKRHAKPDTENYDWTLINQKIADKDTKPLQRDMAEYMKKHPEMVKHIDPEDLMASEGLDILKTEYPGVYKLLNTHQGTASPKLSHSETPYNYEILQSAKMTREEAESVGGVRIQSFSDYVANMFFDYVQLIGDLAAKRLPAQAYTKEADFVKLFGLTGIKINMSLVPAVKELSDVDKLFLNSLLNDKGEIPASRKKTARFQKLAENAGLDDNGNYIWAKESFGENGGEEGFQLAVELQKKDGYRENIGTVAVGVSDAHILKLLGDPDIRMVIPYHKSGINPAVALANNVVLFKDYTNYQNTRIIVGKKKTGTVLKFNAEGQAYIVVDKKKVFVKTKDGRDIPYFDFYKDLRESGDAKKTAQNYLDYCDEYGLIPKFDAFRDNPNYYKLLIDFNTYDAVTEEYTPQRAVEMKLPDDFGKIVEESLGKSQADADRFEAEKPAILDEIRKEVLYKEPEGRKRFSLSEEEEVRVEEFMEKYRAAMKENTALKAKAAREENAKLNEMIKRILAEDKHKAELKQTESDLKKTFKEKEAHRAKQAELEKTFAVEDVALGKDIGYQREMREQKRRYQEKIKENNRKAREDKLKAVAYEREVANARVAVEKDKKADSDTAHLIHEKKAVAQEKRKGAERLQNAKTRLKEAKRLRSLRGRKASETIRKNQNKSEEVIAQSVEETYKQITGKDLEEAPKNVKTVWEAAKNVAAGTKASAREARAIFVRGTQELDVFDRVQRATKQTDIIPVTTGVKMVRAAANTCEYIHSKALVNAKGDIIGKALKDVVLCYDENGKYRQKDQNVFQMYLLAMHTVDRMSFKERAEQLVTDFEAAHPGLAEMSPEEFALLSTQTKAEEGTGKYPYTREVADQYIKLMDNAQKAKNKPVLKADDGTAVRADTAKTIAESLEAENPWLKDKAQELYDWYDTFMQEWVVGTRLSQEQYDVLKRLYPHYVPTYRVKEYESGKVSFTGRQGVSVADVMKRAKGGLSEVMPIEDSFYNLINGFVKQHRDAELRNAMYQSMEQNPEEFAGLGCIDTEVETEELLTDVEGSLDTATIEEIKDVGYKVSTWMNGEKKSMWVSKELYNSLRSLDGDASPLSDEFKEKTKLVRTYVNLRKTLITGINPFFGIRNVVRDLQSALIYTEGSPLHFSRLWFRAWREMTSKSENWNNFMALGGLYGTRTKVEGGFAKSFGKGDPDGVKAIKKVPATLGAFNEASEAVTRFAEYLGTIERLGNSYEARQQGIRNAAEITLDFGEAGRWGRDINQYVMYWNAQMQGVDKFVRQIKDKPVKTLSRSAVLMSVPTIMCYALASFMDKEDEWDNIPSYVHDDYWVIFVNDEGDYIKVPKTREFGAVISMPLTRLLLSRDDVPDAWDNWSGTIKANFLPSEPISNLPFISTMSDLRANKNYRDVPIISSKYDSITDRKDYEKVYNEKTSILAVKLGELFNMRPIYIDYVMKTEFGSMIAMALDAMAIGNVHNESLLDTVKYTADAAVGKLGIGNSTGYSRTISRFYDVVSETESNRAAKAVEITDEDELHKTPEWQINNAMSKYRSEMSDLSKAKRELIKQTMSKTEREAATAEINAQMEAVASAALDMYGAFKAGEIERPDLIYNYSSKGIEQDVMNALIDLDEYADADGVDFKLSTISAKSLPASDKTSRVTYDISNNQGEYNKIFTDLYNDSLSKAIDSSAYRSATGAERAKILTDAKAQAREEAETAMAAYMQSQGATAHIRSGINIDSSLEKELIKVSQVYKSTKAYFPRESAPATISHPNSKYSKQYEMVLTDAEKEEYMQIYESTYNKYMTQAINSSKYKAMTTYNERRDYLYKVKGDVDDAVKEYYIKTLESRGRGYSKKQQ